jgi:hypothetical protein
MGGEAARDRPQPIAGLSYSFSRAAGAPLRQGSVMKQSLRKTPSQLHLAYKYGEGSDRLVGRHFSLTQDGAVLTIGIDLAANFQSRNKTAASYLDAINLVHNHHKLRSLQCGDNLVRARLIRAWEQISHPKLRMCLELGPRGRYLYCVQPHSLFTGGIQFEVEAELDEDERNSWPQSQQQQPDNPRSHP